MKSKQSKQSDNRSSKVGSDPEAAKKVGGEGDFGVPVDDRVGREYASRETKWNDPGAAHDRIRDGDSARESGVGSYESGTGSGSGGDVDTDVIGIGDGSGVASSGPDERSNGPDMVQGTQLPIGGEPPRKIEPDSQQRIPRVRGSTVDHSGGDLSTTGGGLDNGSVSNPEAQGDDSFAADIQLDDATGENDEA